MALMNGHDTLGPRCIDADDMYVAMSSSSPSGTQHIDGFGTMILTPADVELVQVERKK